MRVFQKIFPKKFDTFFKKIKSNKNLDKELVAISESFINSKSYKFVSNHWHLRNISHYETISKSGLQKLGIETFRHYFNFFYFESSYLTNLFKFIGSSDYILLKSNFLKKHEGLDFKESINYNCLLLALYFVLKKNQYFKFLSLLKDETYLNYNNPYIKIDDQNITSDKLISLFDLEKIEDFNLINKSRIFEIGAGSGRLSECILSIRNILNYTVCDIPPSIFISYKRLKLAFPNKKIKLLVDIEDKAELNREIKNNDITFIFPHQINQIEKNFFDLSIAIDCFHEMDKKTINYYFENVSNISQKIYFSIWEKTKNWDSGGIFKKTEVLNFDKGDYPIPKNWKNKFKKSLIFPSNQIGLGFDFEK